jgi:hypothetical protein
MWALVFGARPGQWVASSSMGPSAMQNPAYGLPRIYLPRRCCIERLRDSGRAWLDGHAGLSLGRIVLRPVFGEVAVAPDSRMVCGEEVDVVVPGA